MAIKIYTRSDYRQTVDLIGLFDGIQKYLHLKKVPHFTTLQKFFKRLLTSILEEVNKIVLVNTEIDGEIIAMDRSRFIDDSADKYYAIIMYKSRKSYDKENHISIDVETRLILHFKAQRGSRFDRICNTFNKTNKAM